MIKHLTKHGKSWALVIDRGVLELLDIDARSPLKLTTDGKCLIISPAGTPDRAERIHSALAEGNRKYGKMLKRLAD